MMSAEVHARVRRLYYAEHWKVGTIASELSLHPDAVHRAINRSLPGRVEGRRPSVLDAYKPLILEVLEKHPRLRATRLFEMVRARGYVGGIAQLRRYVRVVRPASASREAFLHIETLPGEQGQVDWGSFGKVRVGNATRPLSCFVMVLGYSRALFARFFFDQQMQSFVRGHVEAFDHFGGAPRTLLYDNLKSVVLERQGEIVRFHPHILELAGHYHFAPRPCAPYRGNEKGKVERAIQYLRGGFFAAREWRDIDELNAKLESWIAQVADQRPRPSDPEQRSVAACLDLERQRLLPLPEHPFCCDLLRAVRSGKRPYLRFDGNDYSIPHDLVRKPLTLVASTSCVRVLQGDKEVARHPRCFDRGLRVENPEHLAKLRAQKRQARELSGRSRLRAACPKSHDLLDALAIRGGNIGSATARLLRLLDQYGAQILEAALGEALERGAIGAAAVAHICDQSRRRQGLPTPLPALLSDDPRIRDLRVKPHDLTRYDQLVNAEEKPHG